VHVSPGYGTANGEKIRETTDFCVARNVIVSNPQQSWGFGVTRRPHPFRHGRIRTTDVMHGIEQSAAAWKPSTMERDHMTNLSSTTSHTMRARMCDFAWVRPGAAARPLWSSAGIPCSRSSATVPEAERPPQVERQAGVPAAGRRVRWTRARRPGTR
jgi:hypothetical protein